jgi:hypothetical protein
MAGIERGAGGVSAPRRPIAAQLGIDLIGWAAPDRGRRRPHECHEILQRLPQLVVRSLGPTSLPFPSSGTCPDRYTVNPTLTAPLKPSSRGTS